MAERRMFAKTIIDSDAFLDMPLSAQVLYFHLSMRADDEGFINNPKKIQRMIGASEDDCKLLIAKRFIIAFDSGIIVIKHWKIHNYIRHDRIKETNYAEEMSMLTEKENGTYSLKSELVSQLSDTCQSTVSQLTDKCQHRLGKDSIGKDSIEIGKGSAEGNAKRTRFVPPTIEEVKKYCSERNNNVNAERFIDYYTANGWQVGRNKMKDWKATVRTWEQNGYDAPAKSKNDGWCFSAEEDTLDDLF